MFDWAAAEDRLHRISKKQVGQFLNGSDKGDLYGFGFFCDAYEGTVCLVANTEQYHLSSLHDFEARFGPIDPDLFRWDTGNWRYPGGLFRSSSAEQHDFDEAWKEYQELLSRIENANKQEMLEDVCLQVLRKLIHEGAFSTASGVKGVTVLGPDERQEKVIEKKKRLDNLFNSDEKRPKE